MTDWWVSQWTGNNYNTSAGASTLIYLGVVLAFTILVFLRTFAFTMSMLRAGTNLHNSMFGKVLRAKMSFFWSVPTHTRVCVGTTVAMPDCCEVCTYALV